MVLCRSAIDLRKREQDSTDQCGGNDRPTEPRPRANCARGACVGARATTPTLPSNAAAETAVNAFCVRLRAGHNGRKLGGANANAGKQIWHRATRSQRERSAYAARDESDRAGRFQTVTHGPDSYLAGCQLTTQAASFRLETSGSVLAQGPSSVRSIGRPQRSQRAAKPLCRLIIEVSIGRCRRSRQLKLMGKE
jgi:hypothetical protein